MNPISLSLIALWLLYFGVSISFYEAVDGIKAKADFSNRQSLPHAQLAKEAQFHILSVWQWLTNISATRGLDGLDKGFQQAEAHRGQFFLVLEQLKHELDREGDGEGIRGLDELKARFTEFLAVGREMAQVYIDAGPQAGNRHIVIFDEAARAMSESLERLVEKQQRGLFDSLRSINDTMGWVLIFMIPIISIGFIVLGIATITIRSIHGNLRKAKEQHNRDIIWIKEVEEALKWSESFKSSILQTLAEGVLTVDDMGRVLEMNAAMEEIFGYSSQEAIGKTVAELFIPPEYRHYHTEGLERYLGSGRAGILNHRFERPAITKDGSRLSVEMFINEFSLADRSYFTAFIRDVTVAKAAEEELHRLATAVEHIAEAIVVTDAKGVIQYVNPAFERITGYPREEAVGKTPNILNSGILPKAFFKELWGVILAGSVWQGQVTNRRRDGSIYIEEMTISPIRDKSGEIVQFVAIKRDVTREREMEAKLIQSQKMEAIGVLAGGIAHDFNNILTPIIGNSELAKMHLPPFHKVRQNLDVIEQGALRARDLVKQILLFGRGSKGEKKTTCLKSLAKEVLKLLRAALPITIDLEEHIAPNLPAITADPVQMHSVLMNICTNARQALPNGGKIVIGLSEENLEEYEISVGRKVSGRYIRLRVEDNGVGIDQETLPHIFDPFFTTKDVNEGTGLGLSTVFGIVEAHHGFISVNSEKGKGTTFNVYFPITEKENAGHMELGNTGGTFAGEKILFVDDEAAIVEIGKRGLERMGLQVTGLTSPQVALDMFSSDPEGFDLVITDRTMPNMTGEALTGLLRAYSASVPVVLMTGNGEGLGKDMLVKLGIGEVLIKPFTLRELGNVIWKSLDERRGGQRHSA